MCFWSILRPEGFADWKQPSPLSFLQEENPFIFVCGTLYWKWTNVVSNMWWSNAAQEATLGAVSDAPTTTAGTFDQFPSIGDLPLHLQQRHVNDMRKRAATTTEEQDWILCRVCKSTTIKPDKVCRYGACSRSLHFGCGIVWKQVNRYDYCYCSIACKQQHRNTMVNH